MQHNIFGLINVSVYHHFFPFGYDFLFLFLKKKKDRMPSSFHVDFTSAEGFGNGLVEIS